MPKRNHRKPGTHSMIVRPTIEDRLINRKVELDEDKLLYLRNHYKKLPRSKLAKRLGISKIDLLTIMRIQGLGDNILREA